MSEENLPRPNTDAEVYLAAIVGRLDRLLSVLEPQPEQPVEPEAPKPTARKRATKSR